VSWSVTFEASHSVCRLVSPWNIPTLTAVNWLPFRYLLKLSVVSVLALSRPTITYRICRLVSPASNPTLTPVIWLFPRLLFATVNNQWCLQRSIHKISQQLQTGQPREQPRAHSRQLVETKIPVAVICRQCLLLPGLQTPHPQLLTGSADWSAPGTSPRSLSSVGCRSDTCCSCRLLACLPYRVSQSLTDFAGWSAPRAIPRSLPSAGCCSGLCVCQFSSVR
jgi:hypothetical protein